MAEPAQRTEVAYFHLELPWKLCRELTASHGTEYGVLVKEPDDNCFAKVSLSDAIIRTRQFKALLVT
jgi:hypothetical protein